MAPSANLALFCTAARLASQRAAGTVDTALDQVTAWPDAVNAALRHGVAGLVCRHLLSAPPEDLPADLPPALPIYVEYCRTRHAEVVSQLLLLLDALAAAGIQALPFKGPALASLAWDEPALRPCGDLDLLIMPADIDATLGVLQRMGYRSQYPDLRPALRRAYHHYNGQDAFCADRRLPVEPHWAFAPRALAAPLDTAPLFARAQAVTLGGRPILTLSPEDALLVAGLHGAKEQWCRFVWVVDVAGLLCRHPDLDAIVVLDRATDAGLRRMLLLGVALAVDLLNAPCPPALASALAADPTARKLAREAERRLATADPAGSPSVFTLTRFRWRVRERMRDRLRYATRTLFAARVPHFRALDLPDWLHPLYPAVRVLHDFVALPVWRWLPSAVRAGRPRA